MGPCGCLTCLAQTFLPTCLQLLEAFPCSSTLGIQTLEPLFSLFTWTSSPVCRNSPSPVHYMLPGPGIPPCIQGRVCDSGPVVFLVSQHQTLEKIDLTSWNRTHSRGKLESPASFFFTRKLPSTWKLLIFVFLEPEGSWENIGGAEQGRKDFRGPTISWNLFTKYNTLSQIAKHCSITTDKNNHCYLTWRLLHFTTSNYSLFFFVPEHGGNSSNADNSKPAFRPCSIWPHPGCSFGHIVHQEIFEKPCPGHLLCGWAGWSGMLSPLLRMPQERSLR